MFTVVMPENRSWYATVTNSLDHRSVIAGIAQYMTLGQHTRHRVQAGVISHVAGCEQKGCLLLVQVSQSGLELLV